MQGPGLGHLAADLVANDPLFVNPKPYSVDPKPYSLPRFPS